MTQTDVRPGYENHLLFPAVFSGAECGLLVDLGAALRAEPAALEGEQAMLDDQLRSATTAWMGRTAETDWVFERLQETADKANEQFRFDLTGVGEDLQYTVYGEPGSFYTWHQDGLDGEVATRKLTLVAQLSDPGGYEGGELEFLDIAEDWSAAERDGWLSESRLQGSVIAFPAFEQHRVLPLRSGERRSLVCWMGGPPFR